MSYGHVSGGRIVSTLLKEYSSGTMLTVSLVGSHPQFLRGKRVRIKIQLGS